MDEDMSPSLSCDVFPDLVRRVCGRCVACSRTRGHVPVVGGIFVEIDSYAIVPGVACSAGDNSMGLILDARSSTHLLESIAYRKSGGGPGLQGHTLGLPSWEDTSLIPGAIPQKPCRRGWTRACSSDDYQIESSTDLCPCKKRCHFLMTQIALWYLMNSESLFFLFLPSLFC